MTKQKQLEEEIKTPYDKGCKRYGCIRCYHSSHNKKIEHFESCEYKEDNELTFLCEIHDGPRLVAASMMRRNLVERVSFLARTAAFTLISQRETE